MASYKTDVRECPIYDAIEDFYALCEELGGEVREAHDNLPESLQSSGRGETLEETASVLEEIGSDVPDLPDSLPDTVVKFIKEMHIRWTIRVYPGKYRGQESRATRMENAASGAQQAIDEIRSYVSDEAPDDDERPEDLTWDNDLVQWCDEVEEVVQNAGACEFPGQRG